MIKKRMVTDRSGKYTFWAMLRCARDEYIRNCGMDYQTTPTAINNGFYDHMQKVYGIKLDIIDGNIGPDYDIVDEKKYMLYQIKYP
jgi:hypothetical protein